MVRWGSAGTAGISTLHCRCRDQICPTKQDLVAKPAAFRLHGGGCVYSVVLLFAARLRTIGTIHGRLLVHLSALRAITVASALHAHNGVCPGALQWRARDSS